MLEIVIPTLPNPCRIFAKNFTYYSDLLTKEQDQGKACRVCETCLFITPRGSQMDKVLGIKREHGRLTYQGVLTVAAPATVYGKLALTMTTEALLCFGKVKASHEPEPVYLPRVVEIQSHRVR